MFVASGWNRKVEMVWARCSLGLHVTEWYIEYSNHFYCRDRIVLYISLLHRCSVALPSSTESFYRSLKTLAAEQVPQLTMNSLLNMDICKRIERNVDIRAKSWQLVEILRVLDST